jgi:hypothetical protein
MLAGCGSKTSLEVDPGLDREPARLEARLLETSVVFCHCLHGCGPGLSGQLSIDLENPHAAAQTADLSSLRLLRAGSTHTLAPHLGLLYNQPPFTLAPGAHHLLSLSVQHDVDYDFVTGGYQTELALVLGGVTTPHALGSIEIAHRPIPGCDADP